MDIRFSVGQGTAQVQLHRVSRTLPVLLLLTDILGLLVCFGVIQWLAFKTWDGVFDPSISGLFVIVLAGLYLANTYHPDSQIVGLRSPARVIVANIVVTVIFAGLIYLAGAWQQNELLWRKTLIPSLGIFTLWAMTSRLWGANWVRSHAEQSRWLILGGNDQSMTFCRKFLEKHPLAKLMVLRESASELVKPYNLMKIDGENSWDGRVLFSGSRKTEEIIKGESESIDAGGVGVAQKQEQELSERVLQEHTNINLRGTMADLPNLTELKWSGVVVATENELSDEQVRQLMPLRLRGIPIYRLPEAYENFWYKLPSSLLEDTWFAFSSGFNLFPGSFNLKLKRIVDGVMTILLLVGLSPLMLIVAIAIKLDSPGEVFYSQLRTGINGKPFRVYKFRSMYKDAEKSGAKWASTKDNRITRVGKIIRLTRIDELPQIWNVVRGEMSLIGPRPERPEFDQQLREEISYYDLRYLVKPGITGWAQVMYPYGASIEDAYEKLSYDLYYIKNYSFWLDLAIVFKTIRVVLLGKGR